MVEMSTEIEEKPKRPRRPKSDPEPSTDEEAPKFTFKPVDSKPSRKYRKGSKYDPVIEGFKASEYKMVKVEIEGKEANYIRTQLNKRLEATKDESIKVSVVNNICFLEKV